MSKQTSNMAELRVYLEALLRAEEMIRVADKKELEIRLGGMNEFRKTIEDQRAGFISRVEFEAKHQLLQAQVDVVKTTASSRAGAASQTQVLIGYALSILSLILSASIVFLAAHK